MSSSREDKGFCLNGLLESVSEEVRLLEGLTRSPFIGGEGFLTVGISSLVECRRSGVRKLLQSGPDD